MVRLLIEKAVHHPAMFQQRNVIRENKRGPLVPHASAGGDGVEKEIFFTAGIVFSSCSIKG